MPGRAREAGDEGGDERQRRRARAARDRHGRSSADDGAARSRRTTRGDGDSPARGRRAGADGGGSPAGRRRTRAVPAGDSARERASTADRRPGTGASRRADSRARTRAESARPDPASRARVGRTDRDAGRPTTRRPRSDAVRARRSEPETRRPATRARYLTRRWTAVLVLAGVLTVSYVVMFTSLLGVRSVEVIGTTEIPEADVLAAAAIEPGTPMLRLDADEAAARVARLPRVFDVTVERSWPSTVEIVVTERSPVGVLRVGAEIHLVDASGLVYATAPTAPAGLPVLALSRVHPDDPATRAVVTVLDAIPRQLSDQVTTVTAATPGDVRLTLADGRVVEWGNARDNPRKAAVLAPLLTRPGTVYDVATPDFPTVSG